MSSQDLGPWHLESQVASPFDWAKLMTGATHIFPLFSEHAAFATPLPAVSSSSPAAAAASGHHRNTIRGKARKQRSSRALKAAADTEEVQRAVAEVVAGVLGGPVAPDAPLMEAGLDSLGGEVWRLQL